MSNKLAPVTIMMTTIMITIMIKIIHCIYKPKSKSVTDTNKIKKKSMLINTNKTWWVFFRRKLLIFQTDIITL